MLVLSAVLSVSGLSSAQGQITQGTVILHVYEIIEQSRPEPSDPYHLPHSLITPPQRVVEHWTLAGANNQEQSAHIITRGNDSTVTQISHRDSLNGSEYTWWPAMGLAWRDELPQSFPTTAWSLEALQELTDKGYASQGKASVAGLDGEVYRRQGTNPGGAIVEQEYIVGLKPFGIPLGESIVEVDASGRMTVVRSIKTLTWQTSPAITAPVELSSWSPPTGTRIIDNADRTPRSARSTVTDLSSYASAAAGFQLLQPSDAGWQVQRVFFQPDAAFNTAPPGDSGLISDAVSAGDAGSVIYQNPASGQLVEIVTGPRMVMRDRALRTPAGWLSSRELAIRIAGEDTAVWLMKSPVARPPAPDARGNAGVQLTISAFSEVGESFVIVRFAGFDEQEAVSFLERLTDVPRS
jgi:hypothetical protein